MQNPAFAARGIFIDENTQHTFGFFVLPHFRLPVATFERRLTNLLINPRRVLTEQLFGGDFYYGRFVRLTGTGG